MATLFREKVVTLRERRGTAVPLAQWEREKDRFVYENWIERARAVVGR